MRMANYKEEVNYKERQQDGIDKTYYENGKLAVDGNWRDGKLEGLAKTYYENGKLAVDGNLEKWKPGGDGYELL